MGKTFKRVVSLLLFVIMMSSTIAKLGINVYAYSYVDEEGIEYTDVNDALAEYYFETDFSIYGNDDAEDNRKDMIKLSGDVDGADYAQQNGLNIGDCDVIYWGTLELDHGHDFNYGDTDLDYIGLIFDNSERELHLVRILLSEPWYELRKKDNKSWFDILDCEGVRIANGVNISNNDSGRIRIIPNGSKDAWGISGICTTDNDSYFYAKNKTKNYSNAEYLNTSRVLELLKNEGNVFGDSLEDHEIFAYELLLGMYFNSCIELIDNSSDSTDIYKELENIFAPLENTNSGQTYITAMCNRDKDGVQIVDKPYLSLELLFSSGSATEPGATSVQQYFKINNKDDLILLEGYMESTADQCPSKHAYPILSNLWKLYHEWKETAEEKMNKIDAELKKELDEELGKLSNLYEVYEWLLLYYAANAGKVVGEDASVYGKAWILSDKQINSLMESDPLRVLWNANVHDIERTESYEYTYNRIRGDVPEGTVSVESAYKKTCTPLKVDDSAGANSMTSVTTEQYLRLRVLYFAAKAKVQANTGIIRASELYLNPLQEVAINPTITIITSLTNNAKQAAMDMSSVDIGEIGTVRVLDLLNRAEEITRYYVPMVIGMEYDNGLSLEVDPSKIPYSAALLSLFPITESGGFNFADREISLVNGCPVFSAVPKVGNTETAYHAYFGLQLLYLLMENYVAGAIELNEYGRWADAEKVLASSDPASAAGEIQQEINMLVKLHGALDNLGVDYSTGNSDVSNKMKVFMSYYSQLAVYRKETISDSAMDSWSGADSTTDPLNKIFTLDYGEQYFTADYLTGVKISSTYIPLRTNVYDLSSLNELEDIDWIARFHYGYGFYRKALYIDTNVNAAVDGHVQQTGKGITKVATLRDLLQTERDIVLYVDDNYYNVNKLAEQLDGYQNRKVNYNKLTNSEESVEGKGDEDTGFWSSIVDSFSGSVTLDIEGLVKTGGKENYSTDIKQKIGEETYTSDVEDGKDQDNTYVMSSAEITEWLNVDSTTDNYHDEYTVAQSFAVVSSIYRHNELFTIIRSESSNQSPVFVSSPTLWQLEGIGYTQFVSAYNYLMLKNLESQLGIDYESTLDLDAPLYIDIYGNILTESGLVVIPAASNPTLYNTSDMLSSGYTIYTAGFLTYYNNGQYYLPNIETVKQYNKESFMMYDSETDTYRVGVARFQGFGTDTKRVDFRNVTITNSDYLQLFMQLQGRSLSTKSLKYNPHIFMVTEVLRGAPVSEIDKEFEGLNNTSNNPTYLEIYIASKLEDLVDQMIPIENGNTWISLPNLAFMDNVEYVLLFIFKLVFVGLIILLCYRLYIDSVDGILGIKSIISFLMSCILVLVALFSVPTLMDISYYQVNKLLLQDEVAYIEMLNIEKSQEGREIGLTEVSSPESATELYLKIDDVSIPWYTLLDDVIFRPTTKTISEAYEEEFNKSLMANLPGMVKKGSSIYIPLSTIYNTSVISYDSEENLLASGVTETAYASYITPYYIILEDMIQVINNYNQDPNGDGNTEDRVVSYETITQSGGITRTKGLITQYLLSKEFMEYEDDFTGLKQVYGRQAAWSRLVEDNNPAYYQLEKIQRSDWYNDSNDADFIDRNIYEIEEYAREFVIKNKELLGKITDEAFLKVMAMSIAVKHNQVMGSRNGSAIEIYDVDARDIIRLSIADRKTVMQNSSMSFARFVFTTGGAAGVILTALLVGVYFLSSFLKPVFIAIILLVMIASLVIRRVVKRDEFAPIEGFIITLAILCGINALYAVVLKGSILLANTGISMMLSIGTQIVIQVLYIFVMFCLTKMVITNWESYGFDVYEKAFQKVSNFITNNTYNNTHRHERTAYNRYYRNNPKVGERYERDREYYNRGRSKQGNHEPSLVGLSSEQYMRLLRERDERRHNNRGRK